MKAAKNIESVLCRHLGQRTVLGVALPVLEATLDAMRQGDGFIGLEAKAIERGFKSLGNRYLKSDFHPTYIQRRLGPGGFLEAVGDKYRFKTDLLRDVDVRCLEDLVAKLELSLQSAYEARQALII